MNYIIDQINCDHTGNPEQMTRRLSRIRAGAVFIVLACSLEVQLRLTGRQALAGMSGGSESVGKHLVLEKSIQFRDSPHLSNKETTYFLIEKNLIILRKI